MAEPGGLLGADPVADPDQSILDFLGARTPGFQRGQPALPVTGAAAVGAPQGPVGLAGGLRLVGGTGAPGGPSGPGALGTALSAAQDALKAVKFADLAKTVFGSGPEGGAVNTPSGALTTSAPEILRGVQFPDFPASAVTDLPGIGISSGEAVGSAAAAGEAVIPAGASTETGSMLANILGEEVAGLVGSEALPIAGAIPGIIMAALSDEPNWEKAVDTGLITAGAALAPFTYGISALVAGVADLLVHLFSDKQGDYLPQRKEALDIARTGLGDLGGVYQQAAQSGDPAQELGALQTKESGGHVYSGLTLPPDVARQLQLDVPRGAETVPVDWHSLGPQQFEQFLTIVGQHDPSVLSQWVTGSGDVPYLPGPTAQKAADQAAQDARSMLAYLVAQQQAPHLTQAPHAPSAMSPGGGATELEEITP